MPDLKPMSTQTDTRPSIRVIAANANDRNIHETVNVISVAPSTEDKKSIKEHVQLTAAQAMVQAHKTVMPTASTVKGLRTIYINGYSGPN